MLERYNRFPYIYQSKRRGYDTLIQHVLLKKLMNIKSTTKTHLDIEFKMKISTIK